MPKVKPLKMFAEGFKRKVAADRLNCVFIGWFDRTYCSLHKTRGWTHWKVKCAMLQSERIVLFEEGIAEDTIEFSFDRGIEGKKRLLIERRWPSLFLLHLNYKNKYFIYIKEFPGVINIEKT
ncbi:hypothetical protein WQ54_09625 [Bacillus sp. SA1-12]|nr:hypothetical protein WQ54_09625 [Bacillus sp. SA1-12]